jgi:hypothetical protein
MVGCHILLEDCPIESGPFHPPQPHVRPASAHARRDRSHLLRRPRTCCSDRSAR